MILQLLTHPFLNLVGGAMASWLVSWIPDRAVRVQALARAVLSCVVQWARHVTFTVPPSILEYKSKMGIGELNTRGNPTMD